MFDSTEALRGTITNRARFIQAIKFDGMKFGRITPTDIDAAIEFDNRLFIFIEAKFVGREILTGQRRFLESMASSANDPPNKYAISIVAEHCVPSDQDVVLSNAIVRDYWRDGEWKKPLFPNTTVLQAVRRMGAYVEKKQGKALYARTTQSRLFVPPSSLVALPA